MYDLARDLLVKINDHFLVTDKYLPIKQLYSQKHYTDAQIREAILYLGKHEYINILQPQLGVILIRNITNRGHLFLLDLRNGVW